MVAFFQHKNKRSLFPVRRLDYPAHLHRAVEFGFLEEGSGTLSVDGKAHLLEAGDAFIIFPDRVHLFENCRNIRAFLAFAPPEDCAVFHETFSDFSPAFPVVKRADALCPGIHKLFRDAAEDPDLEKDGVLHGYLTLLLGKLIPQLPREKGNRPKEREIRHVLSYLEQNFRENLSRPTIARELGVSESSLSHLFSSTMHITIPAYLTLLRLEEAQHLLAETSLPVTAVASAAGFPSLRTMNRAFADHLGKSPTAYRKDLE